MTGRPAESRHVQSKPTLPTPRLPGAESTIGLPAPSRAAARATRLSLARARIEVVHPGDQLGFQFATERRGRRGLPSRTKPGRPRQESDAAVAHGPDGGGSA